MCLVKDSSCLVSGTSKGRSHSLREVPVSSGCCTESTGECDNTPVMQTNKFCLCSHNKQMCALTESVWKDVWRFGEDQKVSLSLLFFDLFIRSLCCIHSNWLKIWWWWNHKHLLKCSCVSACSCGCSLKSHRSCMLVCGWPSSRPVSCRTNF